MCVCVCALADLVHVKKRKKKKRKIRNEKENVFDPNNLFSAGRYSGLINYAGPGQRVNQTSKTRGETRELSLYGEKVVRELKNVEEIQNSPALYIRSSVVVVVVVGGRERKKKE